MKPNASLDQLKDIHLPPPVGWWPPAPGWWLLLLLLLGLLGLVWWFRRHRRRIYRRAARLELQRLRENLQGLNDRQQLAEVAALLRRLALASYGPARVAPLSGVAWLSFLDQTGKTTQFSAGPGRVLGTDLYRPEVAADWEQLWLLVEQWIRRHRPC
ncbi:MAG: DUF4381 domain-containing protein [Desulfobulbaceae bacterium]|nr:DUF4381 domain-containing protein [Desulfobulbaceae bacterium]